MELSVQIEQNKIIQLAQQIGTASESVVDCTASVMNHLSLSSHGSRIDRLVVNIPSIDQSIADTSIVSIVQPYSEIGLEVDIGNTPARVNVSEVIESSKWSICFKITIPNASSPIESILTHSEVTLNCFKSFLFSSILLKDGKKILTIKS